MITEPAMREILGFPRAFDLEPRDMARNLTLTVFPYEAGKMPSHVQEFATRLLSTFENLGVRIIPYEEALETVPVRKILQRSVNILLNNTLHHVERLLGRPDPRIHIHRAVFKNLLNRRRVRKGVSIVTLGDYPTDELPINFTSSFRETLIVTIIEKPASLTRSTLFSEHFDRAMSLFAYHMTNLVVAVGREDWLLYNFNASHPTFDLAGDLEADVLSALIPKIAAPMQPCRIDEFSVLRDNFCPTDDLHLPFILDMQASAARLTTLDLYPPGKKISSLPFRNAFHAWIGAIHLDERSGMSFGFIARQLPFELSTIQKREVPAHHTEGFFHEAGSLHIAFMHAGSAYTMKVPEVWVLTQRSGANKTSFNPHTDLVKLGLRDGVMFLQTAQGQRITRDFKPSFDTKVILAHAVGNAIIASLAAVFMPHAQLAQRMSATGAGIAHWHGYIDPDALRPDIMLHGARRPHVACSSPQSALYALAGKLASFESFLNHQLPVSAEFHVEPHHGINAIFPTLKELADFLHAGEQRSVLGNRHLDSLAAVCK